MKVSTSMQRRLWIVERGFAVPTALPAVSSSTTQRICWFELLRAARAASDIVAAGFGWSAAVDAHGQLCVMGKISDRDEFNERNTEPRFAFGGVPTPVAYNMQRVSLGDDHALAISNTGDLLSFGYANWGALGHGGGLV